MDPVSSNSEDEDFLDYDLPHCLIAQVPVEPRDSSRLLVVDRNSGTLTDRIFLELPDLLEPGDLLVVNDSRVIPARILARRETGGRVEFLLLRELGDGVWEALARPLGRLRPGERLPALTPEDHVSTAEIEFVERAGNFAHVRISDPNLIHDTGRLPLPPYITRSLEDEQRYQTVYAATDGSAAAPTAGLHFTPETIRRCTDAGIDWATVTLHVGVDTFRPLEGAPEDHEMHAEWFSVPETTWMKIEVAKRAGRRVISVGTTVTRVLETVGEDARPSPELSGLTSKFIRPPYRFTVIDAQITNFHLPRTTLLLMIGAFTGDQLLRQAYRHAIENRYRFYSFGDAMLIV